MNFNYDDSSIYKDYDKSRTLPADTIQLWIETFAKEINTDIKNVLDLGAGTGRFSKAISEYYNTKVYAVEPSKKMLNVLKEKYLSDDNIICVLGSAENIGISEKISLIFISMVIHHIRDTRKMLNNFSKILQKKGYVVIRNATKENIQNNKLFSYFESAKELELRRMPSRKEIISLFRNSGYELIHNQTVEQLFSDSYKSYYKKVSQKGLSVFHLISNEVFDNNLKDFKKYCMNKPENEKVYEEFDLFIFRKDYDNEKS